MSRSKPQKPQKDRLAPRCSCPSRSALGDRGPRPDHTASTTLTSGDGSMITGFLALCERYTWPPDSHSCVFCASLRPITIPSVLRSVFWPRRGVKSARTVEKRALEVGAVSVRPLGIVATVCTSASLPHAPPMPVAVSFALGPRTEIRRAWAVAGLRRRMVSRPSFRVASI